MQVKPLTAAWFRPGYGSRGDSVVRWIYTSELYLPEPHEPRKPGEIVGAEYGYEMNPSWVIFHRAQVLLIVPEEVHSYWHHPYVSDRQSITCLFEIEDSEWKQSFNQKHLADQKHFIINFYDDVVEVLCRELIFGEGKFDVEEAAKTDNRFAGAYLRRAELREEQEKLEEAAEYFAKYLDSNPPDREGTIEYAQRSLNYLRTGSVAGSVVTTFDRVKKVLVEEADWRIRQVTPLQYFAEVEQYDASALDDIRKALEKEFKIRFSDEEAAEIETIQDAVSCIEAKLQLPSTNK